MQEITHLGVYGIIKEKDKLVLIKKASGPFKGMLDLPGGTMKFKERPEDALKREIKEEVGIEIERYKLLDTDSITYSWHHKGEKEVIHHISILYIIEKYSKKIKATIKIDENNDDSLGSKLYKISELDKKNISPLTVLAKKIIEGK